MCCWAVNNSLTQVQGAKCHSVSLIWEPLKWNAVHRDVGFQHLPMYLWTLLACLDSCLSFLIISVLSPCKKYQYSVLIEVLLEVLGINFWTLGCWELCSLKNPVPVSSFKCLAYSVIFIWPFNVLGFLQSLHALPVSSLLFGLFKTWVYTN